MSYYVEPAHYEIAKNNNISKKIVDNRVYSKGWTVERAITQPILKRSDHGWENWKDVAVVSKTTYMQRVAKFGWGKERAALTPSYYQKRFRKNIKRVFTVEQEKKMKAIGIDRNTAYMRVKKLGWSKDKAVSTPLVDQEESLKRARANSRWHKERFIFGRT